MKPYYLMLGLCCAAFSASRAEPAGASPVRAPVRIESLLSARLFLAPQLAGGRLYYISNQSGRLSLYVYGCAPRRQHA